jgi:hypothetical protein
MILPLNNNYQQKNACDLSGLNQPPAALDGMCFYESR